MLFIASLILAASAVSASVSSLGSTVEVGGIPYYVPAGAKATLSLSAIPSSWKAGMMAITILPISAGGYTSELLDSTTATFKASDDVWCEGFLDAILSTTVLLPRGADYAVVSSPSASRLRSRASTPTAVGSALPKGPYFGVFEPSTLTLEVFEAFRLYPDDAQAFHYGVVPTTTGSFTILSANLIDHNGVAAIGVPSRLYYTATAEQPLAGLRFAAKDLYDVKGLKTSCGNRAWLSLYPSANETAVAIQTVLDLGAVLIGKTRMSQFANGEYGTADNVDYLTPFNARGDGYQDPSSSSSGAGAVAGNYPWADFSIGSDTGGSIRAPAGVEGVFGNRPTQDAISLVGALPLSPAMDTACFAARDPRIFAKVAKAWYGVNSTLVVPPTTPFPKKLIYAIDPTAEANQSSPGFFPVTNNASQAIYDAFVVKLEKHIGVKKTNYDLFAANFDKFGSYPAEYVGTVWTLFIAYDQWNLVGKKFHEDYAAVHDGDIPFADQPVRFDWEYGANITAANKTFWSDRKASWKEWLTTEVLPRSAETCSESLWLHPLSAGGPSYKSDYHPAGTEPFNGWNRYSISQLGGVPEVVLTIGQVPYTSSITGTTKYLPVSISIIAAEGCDFVLYHLIESLADAGIIQTTQVGQLAFPL